VIQGLGYILATFDAVSAKLADGAKIEKSFWQKIGLSGSPTQYDIAHKLIDSWLPAINTLRKDYYNQLIDPFLSGAKAIERYNDTKLALFELGLSAIALPYPYLREKFTGYPQPAKLTVVLPKGLHKPAIAQVDVPNNHPYKKLIDQALAANDPYAAIIVQWKGFIAESLKSADIAARQKAVEKKLNAILDTKIAGAPFHSINEKTTKDNFIGTLTKIGRGDVDGRQTIAELNTLITLINDPKLLEEVATYSVVVTGQVIVESAPVKGLNRLLLIIRGLRKLFGLDRNSRDASGTSVSPATSHTSPTSCTAGSGVKSKLPTCRFNTPFRV